MDKNKLLPNFERIASVTGLKSNGWKRIDIEKIPFEKSENLESLLEEYSLKEFYNDFLYLSFQFLDIKEMNDTFKADSKSYHEIEYEIPYALKLLCENESKDIKIVLKHKTKNLSASIYNMELIKEIKETLLKLSFGDFYQENCNIERTKIKDLGKYFDIKISELETNEVKKGRKSKHNLTGKLIDRMQVYLQEYTEMKAEQGIPITRNQASFIYKFLKLYGLLPNNLTWEEDNIRHILLKYRKLRSLGIPWKTWE